MTLSFRLKIYTVLWFAAVMALFTAGFTIWIRESAITAYRQELTVELNDVWRNASLKPNDVIDNSNWEQFALVTDSAVAFFNGDGQPTSVAETSDFPQEAWAGLLSTLANKLPVQGVDHFNSITRLPDYVYDNPSGGHSLLILSRAFEFPTHERGHLVVIGPLSRVNREIASELRILYTVDGVALIAFAIGVNWVVLRGLSPLTALIDGIRSVEWFKSDRLEKPTGPAEIQSVANSVNSLLDRIDQGVEWQRRFIADASHELRTPLAIIAGHANILRRWGKTNESVWEPAVRNIVSEVGRLQNLVDRLLLLSRLESDFQPATTRLKRQDLQDLLQQLREDARVLRPDLTVEAHVHLTERMRLVMGRDDLRQILIILLDNAMQHTAAGGKVQLMVNLENGRIRFTVADTGEGIPSKALPHVFDRFYRVEAGRTRSRGGAGLGLAIARDLVEAYGGQIHMVSEEGHGTTVHMRFPPATEEQGDEES
ncbi:MAG: HAMP domain-containing sensor histidine kinase [Alicyclobacillaceae bacterium]|jgi:signal transduction histidine kinase|uniref:sensor histidine kinase n=1 Tax=Alicyclobacillus sp. SP_1 TaxID=2942475 RepID=UPI0021573ADE|nr:HAMP domain-containing sensor histidine kinase [Alicyclobacillus sp. SP_1]MCY0889256.1 HAMP domain-containing sensor histidine kinase [Alicyclobacillaceae bacterium]MCY0895025.1 HAMP domain-containing sensor histidine kinase [Alicyclobacillaceae bacterium]